MKEPFYKSSKSYVLCGLAGIIGAMCFVAAIFLNSMTTVIVSEAKTVDGASLFDSVLYGLSDLKYGFSLKDIIPLLLVIIIILSAIILFVFAIRDNFCNEHYKMLKHGAETGKAESENEKTESNPSERFGNNRLYNFVVNHKYLSRFIPIVVSILGFICLYKTQAYSNVYKNNMAIVENYKAIINQYEIAGVSTGTMKASSYIGIGKILLFVGIILYIGAICFNFILDTLNEDQ